MIALKLLIVVLLAATKSQLINPLDNLLTIDHLFPASLKDSMEGMLEPVDPELLQQAIADYTKPTKPTVQFFLYCNRSNPEQVHKLNASDTVGLDKTCFVKKSCVKLIIHGWLASPFTPCYFPQSTKNAYLKVGNCPNIILMDYSETTGSLVYSIAVILSVIEARDQGAALLEYLVAINATDSSQIHIIGASLGAQIGGAIAAQFFRNTNQKLRRLTGLEPAGPLFDQNLTAYRMGPEDADFVDVYHTNRGGLGTAKNLGIVDFNVNGGICQPYCIESDCSHAVVTYDWELSILNGPDNVLMWACNGDPVSLDSRRECFDYRIGFGEYISNLTTGAHYIPIPLSKFLGPFLKAIAPCVHLV